MGRVRGAAFRGGVGTSGAFATITVVRFLSRCVVAGRQGDYTDDPHRALPDEPEAVGDDWLRRFAETARITDAARRSARVDQRHLLSEAEQVRVYERLARERHIDVRDELRAYRRWSDPEARARTLARLRDKVERGEAVAA